MRSFHLAVRASLVIYCFPPAVLFNQDESQISAEEVEEPGRIPDPDDFVPPVPPPSYFATFYSCTPRMNRR